jgi:hypothetical protein
MNVQTYNSGQDGPTTNVTADGLGIAANAGRALLIVQNRGTASVGLSFNSTAPAAQVNCSVLLAPATVDGGPDGDFMAINWSNGNAMGVKFAASGTKNLVLTEII